MKKPKNNTTLLENQIAKVRVEPFMPHCFAFGGFEMQMFDALYAAHNADVHIKKLNKWDRANDFNILHCWGLEYSHAPAIHWAHITGRKVVVSALLPFSSPKSWATRMLKNVSGVSRPLTKMIRNIDRLVVVSSEQLEAARLLYGFDSSRISIVPNIVSDSFFHARTQQPLPPAFPFSGRPYILCCGNICRRKNQLNLAKAATAANVNLLIVGKVLDSEENFGTQLFDYIEDKTQIEWLPSLPQASEELIQIYHNAIAFALISNDETQPISALEAIATGTPLMLSNKKWAHQSIFSGSLLVNQKSISSISEGLHKIYHKPKKFIADTTKIAQFTSQAVGKAYRSVYQSVVAGE